MAAKPPAGGLFGLAQAALSAAAAHQMRQLRQDAAEEFGEGHVFSFLARAGEIYTGRRADESARQHGYDHQPPPIQPTYRPPPQQALPPPREPTPDEIWAYAQKARAAGDHGTAVQCFAVAAERGHVRAMLATGDLYQRGEHIQQDYRQAAHWFQRAAAAGERQEAPKRLNAIGQCLQQGKGVVRDVEAALHLYRMAAEAGDMHAQYNAAWYLRRGRGGVAPDRPEARRLLQLSAAQGYAEASRELAEMLAEDRARIGGPQQEQRREQPPASSSGMTRAQALEILSVQDGANTADMKAAWVRLMQLNHPDKGGSTYFAKQLNAARETLGF